MTSEKRRYMLITGLSGSGKSLVHDCLEDLGYYCVDNLPIGLIGKFFELITDQSRDVRLAAVVTDVRERAFLTDFVRTYLDLKADLELELVFLEASESVLIRRFSETRRPHPLADEDVPLTEALRLERDKLQPVRELADHIIDTSAFGVPEVREMVTRRFAIDPAAGRLLVTVESFGFKHGIPRETDLLFDVRFLRNPYYDPRLKPQTGLSAEVSDYVLAAPEAGQLLAHLDQLLKFVLPLYDKEGKSYLTISVGCTGGRHRSVVIANELAATLRREDYAVAVVHRDLERS